MRLVRRPRLPLWLRLAVPVMSVLLALAVGGVFLALTGRGVIDVYLTMYRSSFGSADSLAQTVVSGTPLIFTGLAVAVAFRMQLWNIGAEGQLYLGAMGASAVAIAWPGLPRPLLVAVMIGGGLVGGGLWALGPALLRAYAHTNEIITTLFSNYIALELMNYLIFQSTSPFRDPRSTNFPQGRPLGPAAAWPAWGSAGVHFGILLGVAVATMVWFVLRGTRFGFEMRVVGASPEVARYAGIPLRRTTVAVLVLSGAIAGLAGASQVGGLVHAFEPRALAVNYGYTGIIVASLARLDPLATVVVALLMGALANAGFALQTANVPSSVVFMLEGAILFFALGGEVLVRYKLLPRVGRQAAVEVAEEPAA